MLPDRGLLPVCMKIRGEITENRDRRHPMFLQPEPVSKIRALHCQGRLHHVVQQRCVISFEAGAH